jgi:hypothetical protein
MRLFLTSNVSARWGGWRENYPKIQKMALNWLNK